MLDLGSVQLWKQITNSRRWEWRLPWQPDRTALSAFQWQKLLAVIYTPHNVEVQTGSFPCESWKLVGPLKSTEEDCAILSSGP